VSVAIRLTSARVVSVAVRVAGLRERVCAGRNGTRAHYGDDAAHRQLASRLDARHPAILLLVGGLPEHPRSQLLLAELADDNCNRLAYQLRWH
jgi:hypothetical protein